MTECSLGRLVSIFAFDSSLSPVSCLNALVNHVLAFNLPLSLVPLADAQVDANLDFVGDVCSDGVY